MVSGSSVPTHLGTRFLASTVSFWPPRIAWHPGAVAPTPTQWRWFRGGHAFGGSVGRELRAWWYPFVRRATYRVRCAHLGVGCLIHEINGKVREKRCTGRRVPSWKCSMP